MYFPKREELSFLKVFAFPNASRMGLDCNSLEITTSTPRHIHRYRQLACQHEAQTPTNYTEQPGCWIRLAWHFFRNTFAPARMCTRGGTAQPSRVLSRPCHRSRGHREERGANPTETNKQTGNRSRKRPERKCRRVCCIATCLSRIDRERPELVAVDARNCNTCFAASVFPAPDSPEIRMH